MSRLFEALREAADGAFVTDEDLRIVYWNKAAEAILGFTSEDVTGQFCYEILHGYDEGGHLVCSARCQVAKSALMSKPVPSYDIHVRTKQEYKRWLNVSVFTYRIGDTNRKKAIVHLFHDLSHKEVDAKVLTQMVKLISQYQDIPPKNRTEMELWLEALTQRELEILKLLAKGHGTSEISELLAISQNTVRNHIQHILQKLRVHTRLEAVTYAIKNGLIQY